MEMLLQAGVLESVFEHVSKVYRLFEREKAQYCENHACFQMQGHISFQKIIECHSFWRKEIHTQEIDERDDK